MKRLIMCVTSILMLHVPLVYSRQSDWVRLSPPAIGNDLADIYQIDATAAIAVGSGGKIIKTADGGAMWTTLASGTTSDLSRIVFLNQTTGWIVGSARSLLKTTDGGATK